MFTAESVEGLIDWPLFVENSLECTVEITGSNQEPLGENNGLFSSMHEVVVHISSVVFESARPRVAYVFIVFIVKVPVLDPRLGAPIHARQMAEAVIENDADSNGLALRQASTCYDVVVVHVGCEPCHLQFVRVNLLYLAPVHSCQGLQAINLRPVAFGSSQVETHCVRLIGHSFHSEQIWAGVPGVHSFFVFGLTHREACEHAFSLEGLSALVREVFILHL